MSSKKKIKKNKYYKQNMKTVTKNKNRNIKQLTFGKKRKRKKKIHLESKFYEINKKILNSKKKKKN